MKKKWIGIVCVGLLIACGEDATGDKGTENKKKTEDHHGHEGHDHDHHGKNAWTEEEAYHKLMAEIYHSSLDENYDPLLAKSRDMAEAAASWVRSEIPEAYNTKSIKVSLELLQAESEKLADMVDQGIEQDSLVVQLNITHDLFHSVVDAAGGHGHHDHAH